MGLDDYQRSLNLGNIPAGPIDDIETPRPKSTLEGIAATVIAQKGTIGALAFLFSGRTKDSVLYVVTRQPWRYRDGFPLWLSENWPIWQRFEREANRVYDSGRRHYSARTIGEFLRHETALREKDGVLKVDNNRFPDLARLYLALYPERPDMFELRESDTRRAA